MADLVEIHDDASDEELRNHNTMQATNIGAFDELRSLRREMEFRGSLLGKTWSELSKIMSSYQAQLIHKHEQYEANISGGEQVRLATLESTLDKKSHHLKKIERNLAETEQKLLEKDSEIVRLRTEVHKLRDEVCMKDCLIEKIQTQMAKETMELQNEVNSLKDVLEMESVNSSMNQQGGVVKRRRIVQQNQASMSSASPFVPVPVSSSQTKAETALSSCQLQTQPNNPSISSSANMFSSSRPGRSSDSHSPSVKMQNPMEVGFSETGEDFSNQNVSQPNEEASFYKLDEEDKDDSLSSDAYADQYEQKPLLETDDSLLAEPQMLLSNVHSALSTQHSQQSMEAFNSGSDSGAISPNSRAPLLANLSDQSPLRRRNAYIQCDICGKSYHPTGLARHKRLHLGVTPYHCKLCPRTFNRKDYANAHVNCVHGRLDYDNCIQKV